MRKWKTRKGLPEYAMKKHTSRATHAAMYTRSSAYLEVQHNTNIVQFMADKQSILILLIIVQRGKKRYAIFYRGKERRSGRWWGSLCLLAGDFVVHLVRWVIEQERVLERIFSTDPLDRVQCQQLVQKVNRLFKVILTVPADDSFQDGARLGADIRCSCRSCRSSVGTFGTLGGLAFSEAMKW